MQLYNSNSESNRLRSRTSSYQSVTDLDLPFLPLSVVEHWILATENEEVLIVFITNNNQRFEHDRILDKSHSRGDRRFVQDPSYFDT
jgi:hypothetical protein